MPTLQRPDAYRQSTIKTFDACALMAYFSMMDVRRTPSLAAAIGSLFHRWAQLAIGLMRTHGETSFAVEQGLELLGEVLAQRDVPSDEVLPITMKGMRRLRILVTRWCEYTEISVERIVDTERRLYADIALQNGDVRTITGQLDVLQAGPGADQATIVDHKAQPLDAAVLTPSGWREMGSLRVGDRVVGSDGRPTTVVGVYPQGRKEVFEVEMADGATVRCCDEHLWPIKYSGGETVYVRPLREVRQLLERNHIQMPVVQPVEFEGAGDLPVDPYLLGVLIGDGNLRAKSSVRLSSADQGIVEEVRRLLPDGVTIRGSDREGGREYDYVLTAPRGAGNPLRRGLAALGLLGKMSWEKYIPKNYLYASAAERLALLQGLMDTDGSVREGHGQIRFGTSSRALAEDVRSLVRSLGGRTGRLGRYPTSHRDAYMLSIRLPACPFRLGRKVARWEAVKAARAGKNAERAITAIRPAGEAECQCIKVSAADGLYVTDGYVLTHNSGYARPKQPRDEENADDGRGLTELGWVQSLIYSYLIFQNFASVNYVTFKEWHVFWGETREVTLTRWETERLTDVLAAQVALLDQAIAEGENSPRWVASPGTHCGMCSRPRDCPIRLQVGQPTNDMEARRLAQEWIVAMEVRKERTPYLKGWVEEHGPIEVPHAMGRRYVGWDYAEDGKRNFGLYEPRELPDSPYDDALAAAARTRGALVP